MEEKKLQKVSYHRFTKAELSLMIVIVLMEKGGHSMAYCVDLNSDLGEAFGVYKLGLDEEILNYVTSINLACGWHAGDPLIMDKTVKLAKKAGVSVGAHPGYPDLLGFGRRQMATTPEEAKAYLLYQTGALMAFTQANGLKLQHIKLHGAFYNQACADEKLAEAVIEAVESLDPDLILLVLSGSTLAKAAKNRGLRVAEEVFADRGYNADGSLVYRSLPDAFITDPKEAIPRVIRMVKEGKVRAVNGENIEIKADSICVHGDNPRAVDFASGLRTGLQQEGIELLSLREFI